MAFWSAQPSDIEREVGNSLKTYQFYVINREAEAAIAALDARKRDVERAANEERLTLFGTPQRSLSAEETRKLDEVISKSQEMIHETRIRMDKIRKKMAEKSIVRSEKCLAYSQMRLKEALAPDRLYFK